MSGNNERITLYLPQCVSCTRIPEYYTLGGNKGPMLWLYKRLIEWNDKVFSVAEVRDRISYAYCGECGFTMHLEQYPLFVMNVFGYFKYLMETK